MNTELWEKIEAFNLDCPLAEYGFSTRLAAENAWTKNFTQKAIQEYKKFMYLAAMSDTMVSPSEIVDVVWHQHLVFTQSYTAFCEILGKSIHHFPSLHSKEDYSRFKLAKERTARLYNENFGALPPQFWEYDTMFDALALPKMRYKIRGVVIVAILAFLFLISPFYYLLRPLYIHIDNPWFLNGYVLLLAIAIAALEIYNRRYLAKAVKSLKDLTFVNDLSPAELVYMEKGSLLPVVHGYVNQLIRSGKITVAESKLFANDYSAPKNIENYTVLESVKALDGSAYPAVAWRIEHSSVFTNIQNCMNALKKYFTKSKLFGKLFYVNLAVLLLVLMLCTVRLFTGMMRDKAVEYVFVVLVISTMVTYMFLSRLTDTGFSKAITALYKKEIVPAIETNQDWEWQYFIMGTAMLLPGFNYMAGRADEAAKSSSSGSGCGGGGCGGGGSCGGGGGCGGCGGD